MAAVDYETLARFYDGLVANDDDVAFFVNLSKRAPGRVIELMAGTGRVSIPVASEGVQLTCVDNSPAMLDELRRKLSIQDLSVEVVEQDATRLDLESRFALAFITFHSFEELTEDADRDNLLRRVFTHLLPGGRFVCTLHDPEVRLRDVGPSREKQWRFEDPNDGREVLLRLRTTFEKGRSLVRGRERLEDLTSGEVIADLPLCFRLTSCEEFRSLAQRAGFSVETVYGDYNYGQYTAGQSTSMVWVLARPEAAT
jgi:SAM-dependent methyltransferase